MSENGLHKIPPMVKSLNKLLDMHSLYEPPQGGQFCHWCGTPYPCTNRRIVEEGLGKA